MADTILSAPALIRRMRELAREARLAEEIADMADSDDVRDDAWLHYDEQCADLVRLLTAPEHAASLDVIQAAVAQRALS
ncbi:MAG: hypothetical protein ACK4L4_19175 [Gemmobacter sp.]